MLVSDVFTSGRSFGAWTSREVDFDLLVQAYDMAKLGPTSMNCQPMRIQFLTTPASKARLLPHLAPANTDKAKNAPVVAVIGYDVEFYTRLPEIFPHRLDAKNAFEANPRLAEETAFRNSAIQGAYFMVCIRAVGLDCGPMSGFDAAGVDTALWQGTSVKTNFICNIGYGDRSKLFERGPRLPFDEVCSVAA